MKFRALPPPFLPCSRRPQWLFKLSLQVGSQFPSNWATFPVPLIFSLSWWFYHIFSFSPPLHSSSCPGICSQKSEASGNLHLYTASGVCAVTVTEQRFVLPSQPAPCSGQPDDLLSTSSKTLPLLQHQFSLFSLCYQCNKCFLKKI